MTFKQAWVNGVSNCDSLMVAKCLVISLVTRMNGFTRFPLSPSRPSETTAKGTGLGYSTGKEDPVELDPCPTL